MSRLAGIISIIGFALLSGLAGCDLFPTQAPGSQPRSARVSQSDAFGQASLNAQDRLHPYTSASLQNADDRRQAADSSGALPASVVRDVPSSGSNTGLSPTPPTAAPVQPISPAVRAEINLPATAPARRPGESLAQYQTLGAVVTEVSGTPIYADKVIAALAPLLSSAAKQHDFDSYKVIARSEIDKQVAALVENELEFAAALQNLNKEEKDYADNYATAWRQHQITEAGGSLEMARRKALADGVDFDQSVKDEYRREMVLLYIRKEVLPKVQVTADDLRHYYDQHLKTEFTQIDEARFRVIKITTKNMGGREKAIDKIKELRAQAAGGEDFAKLATQVNHDPGLMRSGGRVGGGEGWIQRGAYAVTPVEDAVWKLQIGQITDVIEAEPGSFYIARLEDRKPGRTQPFESESVQSAVREKLTKQQMAQRRDQLRRKLIENSVIYPDPPVVAPVLEIALQKYQAWSAAAPASAPTMK